MENNKESIEELYAKMILASLRRKFWETNNNCRYVDSSIKRKAFKMKTGLFRRFFVNMKLFTSLLKKSSTKATWINCGKKPKKS